MSILGRAIWFALASAVTGGAVVCFPARAAVKQPDIVEPAATRALASLVLLDLNAVGDPLPNDYAIASWMLECASSLAPKDEQVLRLLIDATGESGDRDRVIEQSIRLLGLDSADTVALLRVISGRISALQDADLRLAAYERALFGEKQQGLDPSVRSRLALDAALLLRERGDLTGFASKLALASELDSTNKDAASLAVAFFSQQKDDGPGRLQLLLNLLLADPLDFETHLAIARELTAGGDDKDALRFYTYVQALNRVLGRNLPQSVEAEAQTAIWNLEGPTAIVQNLRAQVEQARAELVEAKRQGRAGAQDPDNIGLALELERVRSAAAAAAGDEAQLEYAFGELARTSLAAMEGLRKIDPPPTGEAGAERDQRLRTVESEFNWMRLWCGRQLDEADAWLETVRADPASDVPTVNRFQGWLLLGRGDLVGAEQALSPLAPDDSLAALGLAAIAEKRGDADAADRYSELSRTLAGTLAGAWAKTRATKLAGRPPEPHSDAAKLREIIATVPDWLEAMIAQPQKITAFQASLATPRLGVLGSGEISIRLRNLASAPLGVGPERPINTRMLLVPAVTIGLEPVGGAPVTVVRLDRRLRLLPQEVLEARVWATGGLLGWFLDDFAGIAAQVRWQVIQGFVVTNEGLYRPGPLNSATNTGVMTLARCASAMDNGEGLKRWIETGADVDVAEAVLAMRWKRSLPAEDATRLSDADAGALGDAIAKRYPTLTLSGRVLVICLLPPGQTQEWVKPIDTAALDETDPIALAAVLLSRVTDPQSPIVVRAAASGDQRLVALSDGVRLRLEDGGACFARMQVKGAGQPAPATPEGGGGAPSGASGAGSK